MGYYKEAAVRLQECERTCPFCEEGELTYNGDYFDPRLNCNFCEAEVMVVSLCGTGDIGGTNASA